MGRSAPEEAERVLPSLADAHHQWWQAWFDLSEDAQVVCQRDGFVLEANRKAAQLLGLTPERLRQEPDCLLSALEPAVRSQLSELLRRNQGRVATLPGLMLRCPSQLHLVADLQITPLGQGCALLAFRDASRRWRMETHLQRLMTAMDATPDVVYLTDPEGKIAFVNSTFQTATGYTIEDTLGRPADFLRSPRSHPQIEASVNCVRSGRDWRGEMVNRRGDGSEYPVEVSLSPIFDKTGECMGYAALERDLTLRNRLEEELSLQRDYALSIVNSLDAAVYTLDRDYRLCHLNDGWVKFPHEHGWLDLSVPPATGQAFLELVKDAEHRTELRQRFETVLATGAPQEIEGSGPSGCWWSIKISPWLHNGEVRGLLYAVTDHTKQHELQHQLYQAQKMETVGALAAGVAHDFNNLLQAIRGNTGLLLLENALPPEELQRRLEQIDQAAVRAGEITQQLLSFSRVHEERGRVTDLNTVIREAAQLATRSLHAHVELKLEPSLQPLNVRLDPTRAQQVLLNLYFNAQDAMPEGGRVVLANAAVPLTEEQAARAGCGAGTLFARCSVSDNGAGIPAEVLPKIFDPFFTTKDKGKGTGLGLAIVQTVIAQAKGFIEVETGPGEGTAFHLYLPIANEPIVESAKPAAPTLDKNSGTILVVDDLDLVLDFTRTFLKTAGYEVLVSKSAEEALKILERHGSGIDLLFTDQNMSGMNGHQLIEEAARRWPHLKFILATGYLEGPERQQVEMCPGVQILDKPFSMREAAQIVNRLLGSRPAGDDGLT